MTVRVAAPGIEIPVLYLLPGLDDLLGDRCDILGSDEDLYLPVFLFLVGLDKIKFRADHFPVLLLIAIHQDLVKYGLTPVVAAIRIPGAGGLQLVGGLIDVSGL